jgi:hypothetical protein
MNNLLRYCCLIIGTGLFSCSKTIQTPSYSSYYGQWQFTSTVWGPFQQTTSSDSVVILRLMPGNTYVATLNGNLAKQGSFTIDSGTNGVILSFRNITQPFGANTSGESNGVHYIGFNTVKIGQLTLFQYNATSSPGDTLYLISYPLTPEATIDYFKRIQ